MKNRSMNLLVHVPYCKHWSFDFKEIMRAEIYNIKRSYLFTQFYLIIHDRLTIEQTKRGNSLSLQNCRNLSLSLSLISCTTLPKSNLCEMWNHLSDLEILDIKTRLYNHDCPLLLMLLQSDHREVSITTRVKPLCLISTCFITRGSNTSINNLRYSHLHLEPYSGEKKGFSCI